MKKIKVTVFEKMLANDIRDVLANDVCKAQCLDVVVDRNRVKNELLKMIKVKYIFMQSYEQSRKGKASLK